MYEVLRSRPTEAYFAVEAETDHGGRRRARLNGARER